MAVIFKKATVNSSKVPSTQTNMPVYVDLARLGVTTLAEANSLRVYTDMLITECAREIVSVTEMWVKVPSLTSTVELYIYGDGVSSDYSAGDTYGRNNVWTDYRAVYHLEDLTLDSTGNSFTLTNNNTVGSASAKFSNGADGGASNTNKYLSILNDLGITNGNISASLWVRLQTEIGAGEYTFYEKGDSGNNVQYRINYEYNGGSRRLSFTRLRQGTATDSAYVTQTLGTSDLFHLYLTYDGSTVRSYVNGVAGGTISSTGNGLSGGVDVHYLLAQRSGGSTVSYASAIVDEARTTSSVRGADWITTEYNNQSDEATFWGTWTNLVNTGFVPKILMV